MFRALSDPTRLRILNLLLPRDLCVCEIVDGLGIPQPTASRHLAYLRKAGLVDSRKDGLWIYYRLAPPRNELHDKLLACLACCAAMPQLAADAKRVARQSGCCA
jgi:ArsR family transcriptional regulator